jgi:hypothetical protein
LWWCWGWGGYLRCAGGRLFAGAHIPGVGLDIQGLADGYKAKLGFILAPLVHELVDGGVFHIEHRLASCMQQVATGMAKAVRAQRMAVLLSKITLAQVNGQTSSKWVC